jgi:hypothetical protein
MKKVRAHEFRIPKQVSALDFEAICEAFGILPEQQQRTKVRLDELVAEFVGWMTREKKEPDRRSDHDRLKKAHANIMEVAATLERLGPSGRLACKVSAPILLECWLRNG